jgi:hypothetical protein
MIDFENTIEATIKWQKENYPERTDNYEKCKRDLNFVLTAYKDDISSNSTRSITYIASKYWFADKRQIQNHHVEIAVHNYVVDYILKNAQLGIEEEEKLVELKNIFLQIIEHGPKYMNYTYMHKYRYIMEYDKDDHLDPHVVTQCLHEAWNTNPSKQNMMPFNVFVLGPDKQHLKELVYYKSVQREYKTNYVRYPGVDENDFISVEREMLNRRSRPQYSNFKTAPYMLLFNQRVATANPWNQWLIDNMHMNFEQIKSDSEGLKRGAGLSLLEIGMFVNTFSNLCLMHGIDISHTRCLPTEMEFWREPEFNFLTQPPQLIMTIGRGIKTRREFYPDLVHAYDYKPDFDEIVKFV